MGLLHCRELVTQNSLCHPHIVHLQRTFLTGTHLGIVLEYMPGSDLFQYCEYVLPHSPYNLFPPILHFHGLVILFSETYR